MGPATLRIPRYSAGSLKKGFWVPDFLQQSGNPLQNVFVILSATLKNCRSAPSDEWGKPLQTAAPNPADRLKNGWLHF